MIKEILIRLISGILLILVILFGLFLLLKYVVIPGLLVKAPIIIKDLMRF